MKYLFLFSVLTAFAANAQNFSPSAGAGVPASTAPQGAGTTLQGVSPSTVGAGNFASPASSVNTGVTPANTNTTLGDGRTQNPNLNQPAVPSGIPNDTTQLNTPSNNPIQQSQEDPLNFSTLPDTTTPSSTLDASGTGTDSFNSGTNTTSPVETFPTSTTP